MNMINEAFWQIKQYAPFEDFWMSDKGVFYGFSYKNNKCTYVFQKPEDVIAWIKAQPDLYKIQPKELKV